jgi:hypothetical protein
MKNVTWKRAGAGVAAFAAAGSGLFALGLGATPASAATALSYGFDGNAHLIVAGGSDTTYTTMIALGDLWNQNNTVFNNAATPGSSGTTCSVITAATAATGTYPSPTQLANQRSTAQQANAPSPQNPGAINCNHDTVAEAYPAGSSTGIAAMNGNKGGTAGVFPYEGTNEFQSASITNGTAGVLQAKPAPITVAAINGSAAAIAAGTTITSLTLPLPYDLAAQQTITLGTMQLTVSNTQAAGSTLTSTNGSLATVTVNPAASDNAYTPGTSTATITQAVTVTAINGATTAVTSGTTINNVTLSSVPSEIHSTDTLTLLQSGPAPGTFTTLSLTPSASQVTATGATVVNVTAVAANGTYTPGPGSPESTVTDTSWTATANNQPASFSGYGVPDLARSSRQPNTSGGNCGGGNELTCDTFFGFATDGVQIFSWNFGTVNRATEVQTDLTHGLTADDLCMIWTGQWTMWNQIPGLGAITDNGPIVPWRMNSGSGTEATFNNFIKNNTQDTNHCTGVSTLNVSTQATARPLHDGTSPFENDTKPVLNDAQNNVFDPTTGNPAGVTMPQCTTANSAAGIVDNAASCQDPANWIWWGSFGLMSSHSFLSSPTLTFPVNPTTFNSAPLPLADQGTTTGQENPVTCGQNGTTLEPGCLPNAGDLPGSSIIGSAQYPLSRDLYIAAPKTSADCPLNTASITEGGNTYAPGTICDLTGTAGAGQQADIQVNGAPGGSAGAVREFIRFVCRNLTTQQTLDGFSKSNAGTNFLTEITTALSNNGFLVPPLQSATHGLTTGFQTAFKQAGLGRSSGSRCSVLSIPNTVPAP